MKELKDKTLLFIDWRKKNSWRREECFVLGAFVVFCVFQPFYFLSFYVGVGRILP